MSDKEVVKRYLELSDNEIKAIKKELHLDKVNERNLLTYKCVDCMRIMTGIDATSRLTNRKHADARAVISYIMREKGYNDSEIGRVLNKDRTAIGKYVNDISFYLEHNVSSSRVELLKRFRKYLEDYDSI